MQLSSDPLLAILAIQACLQRRAGLTNAFSAPLESTPLLSANRVAPIVDQDFTVTKMVNLYALYAPPVIFLQVEVTASAVVARQGDFLKRQLP
jgi:hypothetical protein